MGANTSCKRPKKEGRALPSSFSPSTERWWRRSPPLSSSGLPFTTPCHGSPTPVSSSVSATSDSTSWLYFLRQLRKFRVSRPAMIHFYMSTIESVLTFSMLVWYGSTTSQDKSRLEKWEVVRRASKIIGCNSLPSLTSLYTTRLTRKANKITTDQSHPAHYLFNLLPSGRRYRSIKSKTSRFRDSTYLQVIRLLNSH